VFIALAAGGGRAVAQSPAIDITIDLPQFGEQRIQSIRRSAAQGAALLGDWFPPAPPPFTVATSLPGTHWIAPERGAEIEHAIVRAYARELWGASGDRFREAVAEYTAAMAVHHTPGPVQVHVERFFGGLIPFPVRQLSLTSRRAGEWPALRYFGPPDHLDREVDRWLRSLTTLERYVGWPAFQQALAALHGSEATPERLQQVLGARTGRDMGSMFALLEKDDVDYAIAGFTSAPVEGGRYRTEVHVRRAGSGMMALPVAIRFSNGEEVRDWIAGSGEDTVLHYDSPVRAEWASVDPDAWLIVDRNRRNNTRKLEPQVEAVGIRLALNWMAWLQGAMLAWTAVL
jgi:hypothetical protein